MPAPTLVQKDASPLPLRLYSTTSTLFTLASPALMLADCPTSTLHTPASTPVKIGVDLAVRQETKGESWRLLWSGRLFSRTSVIELDTAVRLPALGARGFFLWNPDFGVRLSAPNCGQVSAHALARSHADYAVSKPARYWRRPACRRRSTMPSSEKSRCAYLRTAWGVEGRPHCPATTAAVCFQDAAN